MALSLYRPKQRPAAAAAGLSAVAVMLLLVAPPRAVGTAALLSVSTVVNANCTMSTSAVSFGRYETLRANATAPLNAVGALSIACTKGLAPKIAMDLGQNPSGGRRYMVLAAGGGVQGGTLRYELYQPPNAAPGTECRFPGTVTWGSAAQALVPSPPLSRAERSYSICGTIPAGQDTSMGSYADTVVATVNF